MLRKEDETDAQVNWEDQQRINEFGRSNLRFHELMAESKGKNTEIDALNDAILEIELVDDDERVKYLLGEVYVELKKEDAVSRLEERVESLKKDAQKIEETMSQLKAKMAELRLALYDKFGSAINLEDKDAEH